MKSEPRFPVPAPSEGASGATPRRSPSRPLDAVRSPLALDFALLRGAIEEIPFGVATMRGGSLHYANETLRRLFVAPSGALEAKPLADLFTVASFAEISRALDDKRVFDGRVTARAFDGRELELDVHVETYQSEAQGTGGFLVARDVSLELGTLRRLVEQLGGALFRVRVADLALEGVSPTIAKLTGLDAAKCEARPVLLTALVSSEERERIAFLFRRLVRGEVPVASAQVSLRRPDGVTRLVQIRATAGRDTTGAVRHLDGVIVDATRDPEGPPEIAAPGSDPTARAAMDLTYELLREASQHLNVLHREIRALRGALKPHLAALPRDVAAEVVARLDALSIAAGAAGGLNRGLRHALAGATLGATLGEVLEGIRDTLAPVIGDHVLTIDAGDAADLIIPDHVDELSLALHHLALRAFRFAGSGTLRLTARRVPPPPARHPLAAPEHAHAAVEIFGAAPPELTDSAIDASSDTLRTVPRPDEADVAYAAAQILVGAARGVIEIDDATFSTARSVVRLSI